MPENNKPFCEDSTSIQKHHLMFSVNRSDWTKEIRIVETPDKIPRLVVVEHTPKENIYLFLDMDDDAKFDKMWAALSKVAKPMVKPATNGNNNIKEEKEQ